MTLSSLFERYDDAGEPYERATVRGVPGKTTLTSRLHPGRAAAPPVQQRAAPSAAAGDAPLDDPFALHLGRPVQRKAASPDEVHAAAAHGVAGPTSSLPFLAQIQAGFGRHDVSGIQAHVGGPAAAAGAAMGAQAYATGDHVAFAAAPDLHTAAHEAAHVVQQRAGVQLAGGVGEVGDRYEQHADAVAAAVVRGEPADALLDELAGRPGAPSAGAIQRRHEQQPFGNFWVGDAQPDDALGEDVERISDGAFGDLAELWRGITEGGLQLSISETDGRGTAHAGFKQLVVVALGKLLSRKRGRGLVHGLAHSGQQVLIRPAHAGESIAVPANGGLRDVESATAGTRSNVIVEIDAALTDDKTKAFDADYRELASPVFITIGHELIHARHFTMGAAAPTDAKPRTDPLYHEREEEETIATGNPLDPNGPTENSLRDEHQLTARFGHDGLGSTANRNKVAVPGDATTVGELAALGGVSATELLADNPDLACKLLEEDPGLVLDFLESPAGQEVHDQMLATPDDDLAGQLEDHTFFAETVGPVLRGDAALAAALLAGEHPTFIDLLMDKSWMMSALEHAGLMAGLDQLTQLAPATVLTTRPAIRNAILADETCFEMLCADENARARVLTEPRVKLGLALRLTDVKSVATRAGTTMSGVASGAAGIGAKPCVGTTQKVRGCVAHRVRRVDGHLQTRDEILAEHQVRGDGQLLARLNPAIDWDHLTLGQQVVVPIDRG